MLDEFILERDLSVNAINKFVDDYSIYSYYIGAELEIGQVYLSPLRTNDTIPSFSLYIPRANKSQILFKDNGTNFSGTVFKFVRLLLSEDMDNPIHFMDVLHQINVDFDIGLNGTPKTFEPKAKVIKNGPTFKKSAKIEIVPKNYTKRFLRYYESYDISKKTLQSYNVRDVAFVRYRYPEEVKTYYPKSLCIAYKIGKYYKLYNPYEDRENRFRTDFPPSYAEGFQQLKYHKPFVIITKAMKEVMFLREHFDIDSVAGKSENTMISAHLMSMLFERYDKVYIWLDRDSGGTIATKAYMELYPNLIPINYPDYIEEKDITDRYAKLKEEGKEQQALKEVELTLKIEMSINDKSLTNELKYYEER